MHTYGYHGANKGYTIDYATFSPAVLLTNLATSAGIDKNGVWPAGILSTRKNALKFPPRAFWIMLS